MHIKKTPRGLFLFIIFAFDFDFVIIRIDHNLFDLGICRIDAHIPDKTEENKERKYQTEGKQGLKKPKVKQHYNKCTEKRHNISLDTEY